MTVLDLTNTFREATGYRLAYKTQQPSNIPITNKPRVGGNQEQSYSQLSKRRKESWHKPNQGK